MESEYSTKKCQNSGLKRKKKMRITSKVKQHKNDGNSFTVTAIADSSTETVPVPAVFIDKPVKEPIQSSSYTHLSEIFPGFKKADWTVEEVELHDINLQSSEQNHEKQLEVSNFKQNGRFSNIKIYEINSKKFLMLLQHPSSFQFKGNLELTCLFGGVNICGYTVHANTKPVHISSVMLSYDICIESSSCGSEDDWVHLKNRLHFELSLRNTQVKDIFHIMNKNDSLILLQMMDFTFIHVFEKYIPTSITLVMHVNNKQLNNMSQYLRCSFTLPDNKKPFFINPEWTNIQTRKCTVVCGGKGVGKSTLLKYLINQSLIQFESVLYLDLDPGQPEFTPPGCISVVLIREPVFGPNYSHILTPESMVFLGSVNTADCPEKYISSVKYIIQFSQLNQKYSNIPWFVNTMGFCRGVGAEFMLSILKMVRPDTVVQIKSKSFQQNFMFGLGPDCLQKESFLRNSDVNNSDIQYKFHYISSCSENERINVYRSQPKDLRDMMMLSYFSGAVKPPCYDFNMVLPYRISFSEIFLAVNRTLVTSDILKAFNGSVIGLCHFEEQKNGGSILELGDAANYFKIVLKPDVIPCLGLGLVRGIDVQEKMFYIITPLPLKILNSVNCLMNGSVGIPASMIFNQSVSGHVTYTSIKGE